MTPPITSPTRLTKIICTLGPASETYAQIRALAEAGMNIARINLSHGKREEYATMIAHIRKLNKEGFCIGHFMDTRGAEIRSGVVIQPIPISVGQEVVFSSNPKHVDRKNRAVIEVNYDSFAQDVRETKTILLDNGSISFSILSIEKDGAVVAKALDSGSIGSRRHINLPGADIDLPSLTKKDWDDIAYGAEEGVDAVALSFIRTAEEIEEVRKLLRKKKSSMQIITKIETKVAVGKNLREIIDASDAIMVARGDLGTDIPIEELPAYQDEIVSLCIDAGKRVIVATHMLESMSAFPLPTRAEVTDVAHATATRTDTTMLSGETAAGKHPVKCVEMMDRIIRATEAREFRFHHTDDIGIRNDRDARAEATVRLAETTEADAIIVITRSGNTALEVSRFRPDIPVIACTPSDAVQRSLTFAYGVFPIVIPFISPEKTIEHAIQSATKVGLISSGMRVVLLTDMQGKGDRHVTTVQMREVE